MPNKIEFVLKSPERFSKMLLIVGLFWTMLSPYSYSEMFRFHRSEMLMKWPTKVKLMLLDIQLY